MHLENALRELEFVCGNNVETQFDIRPETGPVTQSVAALQSIRTTVTRHIFSNNSINFSSSEV